MINLFQMKKQIFKILLFDSRIFNILVQKLKKADLKQMSRLFNYFVKHFQKIDNACIMKMKTL
ncbi:hypothetical protein DQM05_02325 [Lactococcus cremoris]|nr:hypothetical protein DQM05_02325 [Lactococcus cremoris]